MTAQHEDHNHPGMSEDAELGHYARRARAIEALLFAKGVCTADEVQQSVELNESRSPADGARIVARAWVDSDYKARLLSEPMSALGELGYSLPETTPQLEVVENTPDVHHLVVCTLCSCYPRTLLGTPPDWYKSLAYRSRAVVDPRGVMREFGLDVAPDVAVRVLDSTADLRYLVLPQRPDATEGMSEADLARLVSRDSMIGVAAARSPEAVAP